MGRRNASNQMPQLIVRGRGNLLENIDAQEDLARLRHLFDELETKDGLMQLLDLAEQGEGVKIFIGSENQLFSLVRVFRGCGTLSRFRSAHNRRCRCDWSDPVELRPHCSHGGLYTAQVVSRLIS